jgi:hypothetical protein
MKSRRFQYQQFAILHRRSDRGALLAVEHRDLAEDFSRADIVEDNFLAVGRQRTDFDGSAQHRHHALPRRPFGEDFAAAGIAFDPRIAQ